MLSRLSNALRESEVLLNSRNLLASLTLLSFLVACGDYRYGEILDGLASQPASDAIESFSAPEQGDVYYVEERQLWFAPDGDLTLKQLTIDGDNYTTGEATADSQYYFRFRPEVEISPNGEHALFFRYDEENNKTLLVFGSFSDVPLYSIPLTDIPAVTYPAQSGHIRASTWIGDHHFLFESYLTPGALQADDYLVSWHLLDAAAGSVELLSSYGTRSQLFEPVTHWTEDRIGQAFVNLLESGEQEISFRIYSPLDDRWLSHSYRVPAAVELGPPKWSADLSTLCHTQDGGIVCTDTNSRVTASLNLDAAAASPLIDFQWSPDNHHLLVITGQSHRRKHLFSYDLDLAVSVPLVTDCYCAAAWWEPVYSETVRTFLWSPRQSYWSPDGSHILYRDGNEASSTYRLVSTDGGPSIPIQTVRWHSDALDPEHDVGGFSRPFALSPDNQWLSYRLVDLETGVVSLYRYNISEQRLTKVNSNDQSVREYKWSPDSQYLSYLARPAIDESVLISCDEEFGTCLYRFDNGQHREMLFVADVSGAENWRVSNSETIDAQDVDAMLWYPDSSTLLYLVRSFDGADWRIHANNPEKNGSVAAELMDLLNEPEHRPWFQPLHLQAKGGCTWLEWPSIVGVNTPGSQTLRQPECQ